MDTGPTIVLCVACALGGVAGDRLWVNHTIQTITTEALELRGANERLVQETQELRSARDNALKRSAVEREALYARDPEARKWADTLVPAELSRKLRDRAKAIDDASRRDRSE